MLSIYEKSIRMRYTTEALTMRKALLDTVASFWMVIRYNKVVISDREFITTPNTG